MESDGTTQVPKTALVNVAVRARSSRRRAATVAQPSPPPPPAPPPLSLPRPRRRALAAAPPPAMLFLKRRKPGSNGRTMPALVKTLTVAPRYTHGDSTCYP